MNRGCVALSASALSIIDDLLSRHGIDYTFYLPQSGFKGAGVHSMKFREKELKYFSMMDIGLRGLVPILKRIYSFKDFYTAKKIWRNADFVLDMGLGDSFSDIYGIKRFKWINSSYALGHSCHKPYCILPQTIGPYTTDLARKAAVKSISKCTCVMTRDKQSLEYVKHLLPDIEASEIIDLAFFMPFKRKKFGEDKIHVGLNISALLWHGGYTRNNQFGLKDDYPSVVCSVIEYFLSIPDVVLHLVPHVVGGERDLENDYAVCFDLCERYSDSNIQLAPLFLDPMLAKNYISGLDFFMGARMHSTIAAFSTSVPVVPMSYSRKFSGLFVDTLEYNHMADLKADRKELILETISESFANRSLLKREIEQTMRTVVEERKSLLYEELSKFFRLR